MTDATVERVIRRVIEDGWNKGDLTAIDEVVAPDYVRHGLTSMRSAQDFKDWIVRTRAAMPDFHVEIHEIVATSGRGATRFTTSGTHTGEPLLGVDATGSSVTFDGMVFVHLRDDRLQEEWEVLDSATLMAGLGLGPAS